MKAIDTKPVKVSVTGSTSSGVTIPKEYQEALNITAGDYVMMTLYDNETIELKKLKQ